MPKKKKKISKGKRTKRKTKKEKEAKPKKQRQAELEKAALEIGGMQADVKTFIKKFKEDISKKRKGYSSFAQKFQKKK